MDFRGGSVGATPNCIDRLTVQSRAHCHYALSKKKRRGRYVRLVVTARGPERDPKPLHDNGAAKAQQPRRSCGSQDHAIDRRSVPRSERTPRLKNWVKRTVVKVASLQPHVGLSKVGQGHRKPRCSSPTNKDRRATPIGREVVGEPTEKGHGRSVGGDLVHLGKRQMHH